MHLLFIISDTLTDVIHNHLNPKAAPVTATTSRAATISLSITLFYKYFTP